MTWMKKAETRDSLTPASADTGRSVKGVAVSISIVSHGQADLVVKVLGDIAAYCHDEIEILLTLNIEETLPAELEILPFPITMIRNDAPKGFGANHNAAFAVARGRDFCVLNPDIRLSNDPFPELVGCLSDNRVGMVAPLVVDSKGEIEDSARRYPTPFRILAKILRKRRVPDYATNRGNVSPDWVAGMFMLIPAEVFRSIGGFDERYFLYYEDVDLCARLRIAGYDVRLCSNARVVHEARRQSHRSLKYLRWHITSMLRFFFSSVYLSLMWQRIVDRVRPRA